MWAATDGAEGLAGDEADKEPTASAQRMILLSDPMEGAFGKESIVSEASILRRTRLHQTLQFTYNQRRVGCEKAVFAEEVFVDYYQVLGLDEHATSEAITERVRFLVKQWHPDVCKAANAHEMTVGILEAKTVLLDPQVRREYDAYRRARQGRSASSQGTASTREDSWRYRSEQVHRQAQQQAQISLEDLLVGVLAIAAVTAGVAVGAAAIGAEYAWKGTDRFKGATSGPSFGTLFWCGIGGWACVICLAVPGTSIITFFCFKWAFFPGPSGKFIGFGSVLTGMVVSALIIIPLLGCLFGVLMNSH